MLFGYLVSSSCTAFNSSHVQKGWRQRKTQRSGEGVVRLLYWLFEIKVVGFPPTPTKEKSSIFYLGLQASFVLFRPTCKVSSWLSLLSISNNLGGCPVSYGLRMLGRAICFSLD